MPEQPRVVLAGASGFIGRAVARAFAEDGAEIRTIGRRGADVTWDDPAGIAAAIDGADVLINLAGKSVNCRYTDRNRDEIFRSRVETTRALRGCTSTTSCARCASSSPTTSSRRS